MADVARTICAVWKGTLIAMVAVWRQQGTGERPAVVCDACQEITKISAECIYIWPDGEDIAPLGSCIAVAATSSRNDGRAVITATVSRSKRSSPTSARPCRSIEKPWL